VPLTPHPSSTLPCSHRIRCSLKDTMSFNPSPPYVCHVSTLFSLAPPLPYPPSPTPWSHQRTCFPTPIAPPSPVLCVPSSRPQNPNTHPKRPPLPPPPPTPLPTPPPPRQPIPPLPLGAPHLPSHHPATKLHLVGKSAPSSADCGRGPLVVAARLGHLRSDGAREGYCQGPVGERPRSAGTRIRRRCPQRREPEAARGL
jgi:hypothetical protein